MTKKQRVAGREIVGLSLMKPQLAKLDELFAHNEHASSEDIRTTLRIHRPIIIEEDSITFWNAYGFCDSFTSILWKNLEEIFVMTDYRKEHFSNYLEIRHFTEKEAKLRKRLESEEISPEYFSYLLNTITDEDKSRLVQIRTGHSTPIVVNTLQHSISSFSF